MQRQPESPEQGLAGRRNHDRHEAGQRRCPRLGRSLYGTGRESAVLRSGRYQGAATAGGHGGNGKREVDDERMSAARRLSAVAASQRGLRVSRVLAEVPSGDERAECIRPEHACLFVCVAQFEGCEPLTKCVVLPGGLGHRAVPECSVSFQSSNTVLEAAQRRCCGSTESGGHVWRQGCALYADLEQRRVAQYEVAETDGARGDEI